jgi:putative mycofactocin binding protein MftB
VGAVTAPAPASSSVLDRVLRLHPQVAVRPERFGALLYHFGTRRLSFLKEPRLLAAVEALDGSRTAREACELAGIGTDELPRYDKALTTLESTGMLQ